MRTAITTLALAGLTSTAHAQNVGTVTLNASAVTVNVGDIITIGVVLSDDIPGASVFAFDVLVTGSGAAFSTVPGSLVADPSESDFFEFGFLGQINPDGAQALGGSSDFFGPSFDAPLDDLTVFTFQILPTHGGVITFDPADSPVSPNAAIQQLVKGTIYQPGDYHTVVFEGVTITVIPAPFSLIPIAFAFPLTARRRRR